MKKRGLSLLLALIMSVSVFSVVPAYAAEGDITVILDGEKLDFEVPPVIVENRTMVPFRVIFEALGMTVEWDGQTRTAMGKAGDLSIELPIGEKNAKVNGKTVEMDVPAMIINDRTLVPLRFVSENSGAKVEWDGVANMATITSKKIYTNEICEIKGNKKAMITIVMDDGMIASSRLYDEMLKKYDLKGTSAMPAQNAKNNTEEWASFIKAGRLEMASHSMTHSMWPVGDPDDKAKIEREIIESKKLLQELFPGQEVICFVQPGGTFMDDPGRFAISKELVMKHYEGMRTSTRGVNRPNMSNWYDIKVFGVTGAPEHTDVEAATIRSIDTVSLTGGWLVQMWHGLNVEGGYMPQTPEMTDRVFSHIREKVDGGDAEIVFLSEGVKYFKELQNSKIEEKSGDETSRVLTLTHQLDNKLFYYPLTLKSTVPDSWKEATVAQGDGKVNVKVQKSEDGEKFIVYDAVPNGGDITITAK